jgi:hypothetical protein
MQVVHGPPSHVDHEGFVARRQVVGVAEWELLHDRRRRRQEHLLHLPRTGCALSANPRPPLPAISNPYAFVRHPWDWAVDPTRSNTLTGPLRYDFNDGAKLVGRERVRPEYYAEAVVADHWVKGPHHFWIEVSTNLMLREWQPFNGLQVKSPPLPCPILSTHVEGGRGFARFCLRRTSTGTLRHRTLLSSTSRRSATRACCILMSRAKHPHLPVLSTNADGM